MPEKWFDRADKTKSWFFRSPKPAKPTPAFSPTAPVQMAPNYISQSQYKLPVMHPGLQGVTGMDILPGLQNMPGAPGSPYPVAAYRHSHDTSNVVNNVATASQLSDIRRQSEAAARDRAAEGAVIDRQLAIAERNRGGRNDSQGHSD